MMVAVFWISTFRVEGDTLVLSVETVVAMDDVSPHDVGGSLTLVRVE